MDVLFVSLVSLVAPVFVVLVLWKGCWRGYWRVNIRYYQGRILVYTMMANCGRGMRVDVVHVFTR